MVTRLVRSGYASKPDVIDALRTVPRHLFVPPPWWKYAYEDHPLEIGAGQTISAPSMVAIMLEHLDLAPGQRVLEVGTGLGYNAALMGKIVGNEGRVYTVERHSSLGTKAMSLLAELGMKNVAVRIGDGSGGLPEHAPYDRIIVTCAAPAIPEPMIEQIKEGGRIVIPVGRGFFQELILGVLAKGKLVQMGLGGCAFVPLTGTYGFERPRS